MVKHCADLGAAEDDNGNEDGQNKQPARHTASFFPIHVCFLSPPAANDLRP
jgi:hypothetical protein